MNAFRLFTLTRKSRHADFSRYRGLARASGLIFTTLAIFNLLGILFPAEEALERTNYQWFPRLSPKQVLASNTCFGRALLRRFEE